MVNEEIIRYISIASNIKKFNIQFISQSSGRLHRKQNFVFLSLGFLM